MQAALSALFSERSADMNVTVTATPQPSTGGNFPGGRIPAFTPIPPLRNLPAVAAAPVSSRWAKGSITARGNASAKSPYQASFCSFAPKWKPGGNKMCCRSDRESP